MFSCSMLVCVLQTWVFLIGGVVECKLAKSRPREIESLQTIKASSRFLSMSLFLYMDGETQLARKGELSCLRGKFSIFFSLLLPIPAFIALSQQVYIAENTGKLIFNSVLLILSVLAALQTVHGLYQVRNIKL